MDLVKLEVEVNLGAEQVASVLAVLAEVLLLWAVKSMPLNILSWHILEAKHPALAASWTGTPQIIRVTTILTKLEVTSIYAEGTRILQVATLIFQESLLGYIINVSISMNILTCQSNILKRLNLYTSYESIIILNGMFRIICIPKRSKISIILIPMQLIGVLLALAHVTLHIVHVDVEAMTDRAPGTDTIDSFLVTSTGRRSVDCTCSQAGALNWNTCLYTIGFSTEEYILETQASPCTTYINPCAVIEVTFYPYTLDVTIMTGPGLLGILAEAGVVATVIAVTMVSLKLPKP